MKTMYKAWFGGIKKVEVVRETDKFVELANGGKSKKTSDGVAYRDTFEEAKRFIVDEAEAYFEKTKRELEYVARKLEQANNLTEEQCK